MCLSIKRYYLPSCLDELQGGLHSFGPDRVGVIAEESRVGDRRRRENILPVGTSTAGGIRTGLVAGSGGVTASVESSVSTCVCAVCQSSGAVHVCGAAINATDLRASVSNMFSASIYR